MRRYPGNRASVLSVPSFRRIFRWPRRYRLVDKTFAVMEHREIMSSLLSQSVLRRVFKRGSVFRHIGPLLVDR